MIKRDIKLPPREYYPVEPWRYVQKKLTPEMIGRDEGIFTTSNGYIGIRGSFEENEYNLQRATFINGFHETWPIIYGEEAFGFPKTGQTMMPVTDASYISLLVDDESFSLRHAYLLDFERALDFKNGTLDRSLIWETAAGKQVKVESQRLVSFPERHMAAIQYSVTVLNSSAHISLCSDILCQQVSTSDERPDPRMDKPMFHKVFIPEVQQSEDQRIILGHSTCNSGLKLVCGIDHEFNSKGHFTVKTRQDENSGRVSYTGDVQEGETITLIKYITYHTSSPVPDFNDLVHRAEQTLDRALTYGYDRLLEKQRNFMDEFWYTSDIKLEAKDPQVNQNLRLHLYHLLSATARVQNSGVGAKGLTGSGYEGHTFWDMDIYMMPFLIYNNPRVARNLLIYRYNMLEQARHWAAQHNQKGAMFPWRTITGEEASAFFLAGTAQYHINADIAFAIKKYVKITGDHDFLKKYGAEILVETARLWADLGFYDDLGKFHIHGVTGPDEYSALVNDNTFTNLMAKDNLRYAAEVAQMLWENDATAYNHLKHKTDLQESEITEWLNAADCMYVAYDENLGLNPQDESFLELERWDLENTPAEKFPLLLNYHPLVLYRYQVIKQADIVLAMFLLGHEFTDELKKRNFDYYDPLTTGDSSLSASIQGIMANELGYTDLATKYFTYAMLMDIANISGNVSHGLHLASMGGIWMAVVHGIGGMRDHNGELHFNPRLNHSITGVSFNLTVRGCLLSVKIDPEATSYTLQRGDHLLLYHKGEQLELKSGETRSFDQVKEKGEVL